MREHEERMLFSSSLVLFQVRRECLSFHLRRTCLSLQLVVCFCSVVHRTVDTSARALSRDAGIALTCGLTCGSSSRLCRPHKNKFITMSSMFAPAHFSCSHSTPVTLTSSSSIPSSRTTSQVTLPTNKQCATPPNEESGALAKTTSSTGYEPNVIDNFDYSETTEIFLQEQSSDTMPSSAKRYHHHCSFRSEKTQRAVDKLITLLKKVCCQVSPCLSVT